MNIQDLTKQLINAGIEENEAKQEIKMLLEHFCQYSETDKIMGKKITDADLVKLKELVQSRIKERKPIQYIIGKAWFMGNYFKVTPEVLIPRDETEILVSKAIDIINEHSFEDALDIGTGSGCIACTIAKNTNATVLGVDISSDALRIALDNVTNLGINNRAIFRKSDLFERIREGESFDIIVSNPPYIPYGTKLDAEVLHEPEVALFAEENGLAIYRRIIEEAPKFLNENGYLMFELGINEAEQVKNLMEKDFDNIKIIKDLANIDRVIYGKVKK